MEPQEVTIIFGMTAWLLIIVAREACLVARCCSVLDLHVYSVSFD